MLLENIEVDMGLDEELLTVFKEFHKSFAALTGITCCLRYSNGKLAYEIPQDLGSELCNVIKESPEGRAACQKSDCSICRLATKSQHGIYTTCHAGLVDFAVPIITESKLIAIINGGQLLPEPVSEKAYHRLCQKLFKKIPVKHQELRRAYFQREFIPLEKVPAIMGLLELVAEFICDMHHRIKLASLNIDNPRIVKAVEYINNNFQHPLRRDQVSEYIGLSPTHFSKLFTKVVGKPFGSFILNLRLRHAKELLANTVLPTSKIADQTGFKTTKYFYEAFRKYESCSPSDYRCQVNARSNNTKSSEN